MGTTYSIKINNNKNIDIITLKKEIQNKLNILNSIFSTYNDTTEISRINFSTLNKFALSKDFNFVLSKAIYYSKLSNGLYDPTVFPLVDLWGFGPTIRNSIPKGFEILEILKKVSYKNLLLDENNNLLIMTNNDSYIDLSSIAKGYAVDNIVDLLLAQDFTDFMVEIGGEVRCIGKNYQNDWIIGIINPLDEFDLIKTNISNISIATSGTYNNYTVYDGVKYSHIINPKTGYPINNNIISASIIAEKCIDADALATILMLLPYKEGLKIIEKIDNVECLLFVNIDERINRFKSKNFDKYLY
jgi:thiamine biosynthesis lipoprotein